MSNKATLEDKVFYDLVAQEIQQGVYDNGLKTMAYALADGDENRARGKYISLRVEALKAEALEQVEALKKEAARQEGIERAKTKYYFYESPIVAAIGFAALALVFLMLLISAV